MKIVNARFTEGEHAELKKLAWTYRRTVASQVAFMVNASIPSLTHQRREHDTDTDPRPTTTISEVLGLSKEQDSE